MTNYWTSGTDYTYAVVMSTPHYYISGLNRLERRRRTFRPRAKLTSSVVSIAPRALGQESTHAKQPPIKWVAGRQKP